ncbi:TsoY family (seleno)protein [Pannonibacter sp.]|uniref:TsoY family (seleno)protein n=1 Tax=Pannonibacter sp. TaxID=1906786 RepID=UPI003F6EB05A
MPIRLPDLGNSYTPQYFLAALGAGGIAVSFFLYLMFWIPHPGQTVPVFEDVARAYADGSWLLRGMIALAYAGVAFFTLLHIRLMVWNIRQFIAWRRTPAFAQLKSGNGETLLMTVPLALAMSVNVGFIAGLLFVPGLWSVVEYLFPLALVAFAGIGVYALSLIGAFLGRVLTSGGFDCARNNSFSQVMAAFTFAMVAVGLAAPASMSATPLTVAVSYTASTFFLAAAILVGAVGIVLGFRSMLENGANDEAAPSLLVVIPFATVAGIALMRQAHGLHGQFEVHAGAADSFTLLTWLLAVQVLFGLLGLTVLRRQGYIGRFITGQAKSVGSYALVCPAVALSVLLQFYINKGLVEVDLISKFSAAYWMFTAVALAFQALSIWLVVRLNSRHLALPSGTPTLAPAE